MGLDGEYGVMVSLQTHAAEPARSTGPLSVAIVGAGPAGLMAAEVLSSQGHRVTVFDRMPSPGRKFLMAGRGGLNLTHSEPLDRFLTRYASTAASADHSLVLDAVRAFPPTELVSWCEGLGLETFTGSSGRVFPKSFKASPLLRAWLARLNEAGVDFRLRHQWHGWDAPGALQFTGASNEAVSFEADAVVLALGGASWPRLGSDGQWATTLANAGVSISPLQASNCGVRVAWSDLMKSRHAGEPLKRIAVSVAGETRRGEAVITQHGLEGNVIYALSAAIRTELEKAKQVQMLIDLRPDESADQIKARLSGFRGRQSMSTFLRKALKLSPAAIALLYEGADGPFPTDQADRARLIKAVPLRIDGLAGFERAISTAGGVRAADLDSNFMLRARPGVFVAGEMLDWDAPTGGYLLQACCATGVAAAKGAGAWLDQEHAVAEQIYKTPMK
jgi:uncharacterized flavoprotein (TIGR03862 family)